jgi:hypothetical protein
MARNLPIAVFILRINHRLTYWISRSALPYDRQVMPNLLLRKMVFERDPARESGKNLDLRNGRVLKSVEQSYKPCDFLAKDEVVHLKVNASGVFRVKPNVGSGNNRRALQDRRQPDYLERQS